MSEETMRRDFERLAKERLETFVEDMITLHDIAELDRRDAVSTILLALFATATKVMVWGGRPLPKRDDLYALIDSLLRSAQRLEERITEKRGQSDV